MSHYNRIQNPLHEATALLEVKRGTAIIIPDEPETREHKNYSSLLPFITMSSLLDLEHNG